MGSKAQAKASSTWAAAAKKNGFPKRVSQRCPVCYGTHPVPLKNSCNRSVAPRNSGTNRLPALEAPLFKFSLNKAIKLAGTHVNEFSRKEAAKIDRAKDFPATKPMGWRGIV